VINLLSIRFRKNTGLKTPPANGGFAVIHGCVLVLALMISISLVTGVIPYVMSSKVAMAQPAPAAPSSTDTMVKDIVTLDSEISTLKTKLSNLSGQSALLDQRIASAGAQIAEHQKRLSDKRKVLSARARSMYVNGEPSKLLVLVSSKGVSDYFNRADMMQKMAERDAQLISVTKTEADALRSSVAQLQSDKKQITNVAADLRTREKRLETSRSERAAVLAKAGANASTVATQSSNVETKIKQINPTTPPAINGRPTGKVMTMVATAYSPQEPGLDDHTASGMRATKGVVAVDPRVIPLGTRLNVEGYGNCIAGDTGSAIKGNRIDLCFDTLEEMNAYGGYHTVRVEILD